MGEFKRMTYHKVEKVHGQAVCSRPAWVSGFDLKEARDRLTAYEDTGLSPDEVEAIKKKYLSGVDNSMICKLTKQIDELKRENAELRGFQSDLYAIAFITRKYE